MEEQVRVPGGPGRDVGSGSGSGSVAVTVTVTVAVVIAIAVSIGIGEESVGAAQPHQGCSFVIGELVVDSCDRCADASGSDLQDDVLGPRRQDGGDDRALSQSSGHESGGHLACDRVQLRVGHRPSRGGDIGGAVGEPCGCFAYGLVQVHEQLPCRGW